jgi:hypothetical protein
LNGAATVWALEGASTIGNVVVTFLDSRNSDGVVVVGTHANGVYSSSGSVNVGSDKDVPSTFTLEQNYPNPFNPTTKIGFTVQGSNLVSLKVYDVLGKKVATLVNERRQPGSYEADFDARNLPSGTYIYTLTSGGFSTSKRMVLVK